MVTSNQYPHRLYVKSSGTSSLDENGDYVQASVSWAENSACREEVNVNRRNLTDGETASYNHIIYLPKDSSKIDFGTEVKVEDADGIRAEGRVLRFARGQFNCQIWL